MENENIKKVMLVDDKLKEMIISDKDLTNYILISMLHRLESEGDKPLIYLKDEYDLYTSILSDENKSNEDLKEFLLSVYKDTLNDFMLDDVYNDYLDLSNNEGKQVIYSLSRLLFIQDKYKDDEIGQKIDTKIKEWLDYIKTFDEKKDTTKRYDEIFNDETITKKERIAKVQQLNKRLNARVLYQIIPSLNYDIYNFKNRGRFTDYWIYDIDKDELKAFFKTGITNTISDVETYNRYEETIAKYLDDIESNINMANFNRDKEEQIIAIREKHNVSKDKEDNIHVPSETQEAFLDDIANAYRDYTDKEGNEFKLDDLSDVDKWRKQADNFIKHLETYDGVALFSGFTMDYTLNHLAYNDYQREAYKLDLKDDIKDVTDEIKKEQTKKKSKKKPKPKLATQEEIQAYYNDKVKEYYNTSTLPTNKAILDTYGAYTSIETNTLDKINLKIKELNQKRDKTHDKEKLDNIKYELEDLLRKKQEQEDTFKNLNDTIKEKQDNLDKITHEYNEKEEHLSNADKQQYKNLIQTLQVDLIDAKDELNAFNNRGIAFRGNIFNELEYTDDKGKTIATIRNRNGDVLEPKDIPPLSDLFLTLTNDNYYTRLDNYNEFIDKIDVLFPKSKGASYKIANETIKRNLGKNGYIISVKSLLKDVLHVSEDSFKYYSNNLEGAIKFFNDTQINVQQQDKYTKNDDVLNMFFGLTNNVYMSRQVNNDIYLYYEISSVYETILNNSDRPVISQNPKTLLKYSIGQKGNRRVFKLGNYIYNNLRESLNNGKGGVKIDDNGHFYKKFKVKSLLKVLKESKLINKEARPRKYREDIFNPLITTLNTLSVDDDGNGERLIEYNILYDDSLNMSNDTFKATFEEAIVIITYLKYSEDYENILAKNIRNKKKAHITNANKFILTFGKYEGKTLKEVLDIDKHYLEVILSDTTIKIPKPTITRQHIKNILDYDKDKRQLKK